MSYAETSYAGPDITGRVFTANHAAHCATRDEFERQRRIRQDVARRMRRAARG